MSGGARSQVIEELNINLIGRKNESGPNPRIRIRCFICHREIDREMVAFVNHSLEEMACVCRKHLEIPEKNLNVKPP